VDKMNTAKAKRSRPWGR